MATGQLLLWCNQILGKQRAHHFMKKFLFSLYAILLGASATLDGLAQQTNISAIQQPLRLYLHVFSSVAVDLTNGPLNSSSLILSTNIQLGEVFEKRSEGGGPPLSVLIEHRNGKYFLHLDPGLGWPEYKSEIEPEVPFQPASKPTHETVNSVDFFVLSRNSDYRPFLDRLNETIRAGVAPLSTKPAPKPEDLPAH